MPYPNKSDEQRREQRANLNLCAQISVGSQLSLQGQLKDLSTRSAFIRMKNSVYLEMNDEVGFAIHSSRDSQADPIHGQARISRIAAGEGLAIYFTQMDERSAGRLRELLRTS